MISVPSARSLFALAVKGAAAAALELVARLSRPSRARRLGNPQEHTSGFACLSVFPAIQIASFAPIGVLRFEMTRQELDRILVLVLLLLAGIFALHGRAYLHIQRRVRALAASLHRFADSGFAGSLSLPRSGAPSKMPAFLRWLVHPGRLIDPVQEAAECTANAIQEINLRMREREARNLAWLSFLCHDLCAPLVRVCSRIEALQSSSNPDVEEQREVLESARTEVLQMRELIASVSDFAQTDRDISRTFEPTDLRQLLEFILTVFEFDAGRRNIELEIRVQPGVNDVRLHRVLIRRALENLVSNALRHTPEGGLVSLHAGRSGKTVQIRISDTGPGIPLDQIEHIFDYGFREGGITQRVGPISSGLGLSLVQKVAALHDGEVGVRNLEPHGAEFTISLPLAGPCPPTR